MLNAFVKWSKQGNRPIERVISDHFGLGTQLGKTILFKHGIQSNFRFGRLDTDMKELISKSVDTLDKKKYPMESDLAELVRTKISEQKAMRSYHGFRHHIGLPVRGQRTRSNARTIKNHRPRVGLGQTCYRKKNQNSSKLGESGKKLGLKRDNIASEVTTFVNKKKHRSRSRHMLINTINTHYRLNMVEKD